MKKVSSQVEITKELGDIMKVSYDLELVNHYASKDVKSLVEISEKLYYRQLQTIVSEISRSGAKFVFITGPSSAGKTTSAERIKKGLAQKNIKAKIISMDNFIIDKADTPLLADGTYDFENVNAIDIAEFNKFIKGILKTGKAKLPQYSFLEDKRVGFINYSLNNDEVLIIEGIHALNPLFTKTVPQNVLYKIYVSTSSNFVVGKNVVINNRQLRMMRRMLRDYYKRGSSIEESSRTWKNVCQGEDEYINCFKSSVNYILNTTHMYEPLLYDKYLSPLLVNAPKSREVKEILNIFKYTATLSKEVVPKISLINEFLPKN